MKKTIILVLLIATAAIIWHRVAHAADQNMMQNSASTQKTNPTIFCPSITQISKNPQQGNWVAKTKSGFWKSLHMSFATNLTQLIGAQWVGENLGQVACFYNSEQRFNLNGQPTVQTTPQVSLIFHTLVFDPMPNGKWKRVPKKRGIRNCVSTERYDCPFKAKPTQKIGDIYQEAESLKKNSSAD